VCYKTSGFGWNNCAKHARDVRSCHSRNKKHAVEFSATSAPHLVCPKIHVWSVSTLSASYGTIMQNMLEILILVPFANKKFVVEFSATSAPHLVCHKIDVQCVTILPASVGTIVQNMLEIPVLATFATKNMQLNFPQRAHHTLFVLKFMFGLFQHFRLRMKQLCKTCSRYPF